MNQDKDEIIFTKRLNEWWQQAYHKNICIYTSFLNLNEFNLFEQFKKTTPGVHYEVWGGYREAERRVICFYVDDSFTTISFPICCVQVSPVSEKYGETLSHRDYLGAVLNLGIDRSKIGDIAIENKTAYIFCMDVIAPFLCDNLTKIRHTNVNVKEIDINELHYTPKTEVVSGTVSSVRLDALLALAFKTSRSSMTGLISGGKVFANGKLVTSNSFVPKEDDIISVRGMGRFVYRKTENQTKKNRYRILLEKYIS